MFGVPDVVVDDLGYPNSVKKEVFINMQTNYVSIGYIVFNFFEGLWIPVPTMGKYEAYFDDAISEVIEEEGYRFSFKDIQS